MATDLEKLVVALEAKTTQFNNALNKANRTAQTQLKRIETQFAQTNKKLSLSASFSGLGNNVGGLVKRGAAGLAAAFAVDKIKDYADAWTEAGNKIAATSAATGIQARSMDDIVRLAAKSRSGLIETVDLYTKLLRATQGVAKSEQEVADATDIVNKAFKAGGAGASEQAAGILQLSQALGSGVLQGDELRSLRENAPILAKAIADEYGTNIAGLKKLGAEGALTSERVFQAILKAGPQIQKQFDATTATIGDNIGQVNTALTAFVGKLSDAIGAGGAVKQFLGQDLVGAINGLSTALDQLRNSQGVKTIETIVENLQKLEDLLTGSSAGSRAAFNQNVDHNLLIGFPDTVKQMLDGMDKLVPARKEIEDLNGAFADFRDSVAEVKPEAVSTFNTLQKEIDAGTMSAGKAKVALHELFGDDPMYGRLLAVFDDLLDKLQKVEALAKASKAGLDTLAPDPRSAGFAMLHDRDKATAYSQQRIADAGQSDVEKKIEERAAEIIKDSTEKLGYAITEAAARIQAQSEVAAETAAKANDASASNAMELIKKYEGFRTQAYFDVNHYRVGYGSDTVTLSDGSIKEVTAGMTTTLAQANADLARRVQEFQSGIEGKIGADTFRGMSEQQQAALTSIAYNYGSLPDRIVEAIKTGNTETIYNAIKGLGNDNGGVNRTRRNDEADVFLNGSSSIDQADIKARQDQLKLINDTISALQAETANIGFETSTMGMSNAEREKERVIRETLLELQRQGVPITDELRAAVEAEANARYGQVAAYDAAAAKAEQLKQAQEDLLAVQEDIGGAFQGAIKGFISDLVHGKSATEALSDAVSRLADRLLDIALDQVFKSIFGGIGGGAGLLGGLLGFADGGYTGNGGTREAAGVVHGQEFVVNARATKKNRRLLEAINAGAPGYAQGGYVGNISAGRSAGVQPQAAPRIDARTKIINTFDAGSFLSEALNSTEGEKIMLNFVRARPGMFKSAIGA